MGNNKSTEGYAPDESTSCVPDPVTYVYSFWVSPDRLPELNELVYKLIHSQAILTKQNRCDIHVWLRTILGRTQPEATYILPPLPIANEPAVKLVRHMTDAEYAMLVKIVESTSKYNEHDHMSWAERQNSYKFIGYAERQLRRALVKIWRESAIFSLKESVPIPFVKAQVSASIEMARPFTTHNRQQHSD